MKVKVWDLPLRLTHWLLVGAVVAAFVSAKIGGNALVWHGRAGLAILGLVTFRILWGFVGSTHARFASFVRGPAAIRAYLRGQWSGLGHNPLGALSVLALLALLAAQAATGLFANDDDNANMLRGYLYALVGSDTSNRLTGIHTLFEPVMIVLVCAHIGAIGFYARIKKTNLVQPMITGWQETSDTPAKAALQGGFVAFLVAAAIAGATVYAASGALLPPPPPAAAETPSW